MGWGEVESLLGELTLPDLLFRDPGEVAVLQDRLLAETVALCYRGHPFYGRVMRREGLVPEDIRSTADLVKLPVTTKEDFLEDPEVFRLGGDDLPVEASTLWEVCYTTGTTSGRPAPIYTTTFDYYAYLYHCRRRSVFTSIVDTDVIANVFPLTAHPTGIYVRAHAEAAAVGAAMVTTHTGRPNRWFPVHRSLDEAVRLVERHRATVIWGVAGFVRRMLIRAAEIDADFSSVRMCMITGEASSPAMRADMARRMRDLGSSEGTVLNRFGSTEAGVSMVECVEGSGFHNPSPDQMFLEVVDPSDGRRLADGEEGILTFTHLIRRGTVFLRYAMGDVASLTREPCPHCGRTASERIVSQPTRTGNIVKVKGTMVNLEALRHELDAVPGLEEYQIVLGKVDPDDPFSTDRLTIRAAVAAERRLEVEPRIVDGTRAIANLTPGIEYVDRDAIYDPQTRAKPQRIIDTRPSAGARSASADGAGGEQRL